MKGLLSDQFEEILGVQQGHIQSSDHYKIYINPVLETLKEAYLGVYIGPINVSGTCVAIFEFRHPIQVASPAEYYGLGYKIKYGATKTKITAVGSNIDMQYYLDTAPWSMDNEK